MSTTVLHPNALPGIPWTFTAKTITTTPYAGIACFTIETLTQASFQTETLTQAEFASETLTQAQFTSETITGC